MFRVDKVDLANGYEVVHFLVDIPIDPDWKSKHRSKEVRHGNEAALTSEEISTDDVGCISWLVVDRHITKGESIETGGAGVVGSSDGKEYSPGHQPDREKNTDHDPEEAKEEIGISTVDSLNIAIIC